ncbi:metallophosphoesterase [Corallococcus terminator]
MALGSAGFLFAAVGDVHGRMNRMVSFLQSWTKNAHRELAFVLQVGDFEPHRDEADLATMAAPARYKHLGDFADYHQNLGHVGVVEPRGLRVVGVSGIHDEGGFQKPHLPLSRLGSVSSKDFTCFNEEDIDRAMAMERADVLLVHDWPSGIIAPQDREDFEQQRRSPNAEAVGNDYARLVAEALEPSLVLCGHLHKSYRGTLAHASGRVSQVCCLASVEQGADAFAVFHATPMGLLEVTRLGAPEQG